MSAPENKPPEFTEQDARALMAHFNSAPLQNMQHAAQASALLNKFQQWHAHVAAQGEQPKS